MNAWKKFFKLQDMMGSEWLANELARAMAKDTLDELCTYIARAWDIELNEDENEDE